MECAAVWLKSRAQNITRKGRISLNETTQLTWTSCAGKMVHTMTRFSTTTLQNERSLSREHTMIPHLYTRLARKKKLRCGDSVRTKSWWEYGWDAATQAKTHCTRWQVCERQKGTDRKRHFTTMMDEPDPQSSMPVKKDPFLTVRLLWPYF